MQLLLAAGAGTRSGDVTPDVGWAASAPRGGVAAPATSYVVNPTGLSSPTLNNYGQLAGGETSGGSTYVSLWTPSQPNSPTGQLTRIMTDVFSPRLNDYGQVAVTKLDPAAESGTRTHLWTPSASHGNSGSSAPIPLMDGGGFLSSDGVVVGMVPRFAPNWDQMVAWFPSTPNATTGSTRIVTSWEQGTGANYLWKVNASHIAIGNQYYVGADGFAHLQGIALNLDTGGVSILPEPIVGQGQAAPSDINDLGEIVGMRGDLAGTPDIYRETVLWKPAYTKTVLPFEGSPYLSLNNHGDVLVGVGPDKGLYHRTQAGGYQRNAALDQALSTAGIPEAQLQDLNDAGQVLAFASAGYYLLTPSTGRELKVFDANIDYSAGLELPTNPGAPMEGATLSHFDRNATTRNKVAADGVTLLLLRLKLPADATGTGRFRIEESPALGAELGSLWPVDSLSLRDETPSGGNRDAAPEGVTQLDVPLQTIGGAKWAFALYRSPRNFDSNTSSFALEARGLVIRAGLVGESLDDTITTALSVVRPLVILQHGTFSSPSTWSSLPALGNAADGFLLWLQGKQSDNGYEYLDEQTNRVPFCVTRTSFAKWKKAAGPLDENAQIVLLQVIEQLADWRLKTGAAGTQADVITHSYGGPVMRRASEIADGGSLTLSRRSFRRMENWGHGYFHKLITIAGSHRGSAMTNHAAWLNRNGAVMGAYAAIANNVVGTPTYLGAMRDQFVMSDALQGLKESRYPSHAFVGSGSPDAYTNPTGESVPFAAAYSVDRLFPKGPFRGAGPTIRAVNDPVPHMEPWFENIVRSANWHFNLSYTKSSGPEGDPNYDLTVSSRSASAGLSRPFYSNISDLNGVDLAGKLSHLLQTNNRLVSERMIFLLQQKTTSRYFTHFPPGKGPGSKPMDATEKKLNNRASYNAFWLVLGTPVDPTRAPIAPGTLPTLTSNHAGQEICPGDQFTVTLGWPGKTIDTALLTWPSSGGSRKNAYLGGPVLSQDLTVPDLEPGRFLIGALVTATDGSTETANLELEICHRFAYSELAVEPSVLTLTDTAPTALLIHGRLPDGGTAFLGTSSYTQVTSADPSIARVTPELEVAPVNFGSTNVRVDHRGVTADVPVTVTGIMVPASVTLTGSNRSIDSRSTRAIEFVLLSTTAFDARTVRTETLRIAGRTPVSTTTGELTVAIKDVNRDGKADLAFKQLPAYLHLTPGPVQIRILAATAGGTLVKGEVATTVR